MMSHGHGLSPFVGRTPGGGFSPLVGRTPGGDVGVGGGFPIAVDESLSPLPPVSGVSVGVVDTGIVVDDAGNTHPWFGDHVIHTAADVDLLGLGHGDADEHGYLADADGHGTFVSGVILGQAPTAQIRMRGILDQDVDVLGVDIDRRVADAVAELASLEDVQVINLSFFGGRFADEPAGLGSVLEQLDPRVAVVAAAGNESSRHKTWPAAFPRVISVGALDTRRRVPAGATPPLAGFSNYGAWIRAYADGVELLAPYVDFVETGSDAHGFRPPQHFRGWARWSGTSFSAALVSGLIAQTAIELGVTGAVAADLVLGRSRVISDHGAVWVCQTG